MHLSLANAVADMIGKKYVTETFAKQYIVDHYIPFIIYQKYLFRMAELKKPPARKTRKTYTKKT